MTIGNSRDLDGLTAVGRVVAEVLARMLEALEPGMTTADLDRFGAGLLADAGARSAPQLCYDFPGATCISINEEAAHGIPGPRVIRPGDVVNVDVSAELGGYFADTGGTRVVPPASPRKTRLCQATRAALDSALGQIRAGAPLNGIGRAVQQVARANRFRIIRNLAGHGVGRSLHEAPGSIPGYFEPRDRRVLREGMVIAVEPFLSTRSTLAEEADDGWTLLTAPGNFSAQFEHTLVVTRGDPIILTTAA